MSEPENPAGCERVGDDDPAARSGPARAVFAGRLHSKTDLKLADGGPNDGSPKSGTKNATKSATAPPAQPPPSASVLRDLIDKPETTPMVWVHHPVSGARLFRLPVELPDGWPGEAAPIASEPAELPPLTAETVLHELRRIAFTDPLPPGERAGTRLPVTLRDKQNALLHLGRHLGLFSGKRTRSRPYAELSDDELKAQSDNIIRALAGMGVEVRIAEQDAGAHDGAPVPP